MKLGRIALWTAVTLLMMLLAYFVMLLLGVGMAGGGHPVVVTWRNT